jgi:hypothetical protein
MLGRTEEICKILTKPIPRPRSKSVPVTFGLTKNKYAVFCVIYGIHVLYIEPNEQLQWSDFRDVELDINPSCNCTMFNTVKKKTPLVWNRESLNNPQTQNYSVVRLCPSSGIVKSSEHNFSEAGSVSVLKWWIRTAYSVEFLRKT